MIMQLSPEGDSLCVVVSMSKAPKLNTIINDDRCCTCNQAFEDFSLELEQTGFSVYTHVSCMENVLLTVFCMQMVTKSYAYIAFDQLYFFLS